MKRELAYALQVQSQFASPLGRTRGSKATHGLDGVQESGRNKRLGVSGVNGREPNEVINRSQEKSKINSKLGRAQSKKETVDQCYGIAVYRRSKRLKSGNVEVAEMVNAAATIETAAEDKIECKSVLPISEDQMKGVFAGASGGKGSRDGIEQSMLHLGISECLPVGIDARVEARNVHGNGPRSDANIGVRNVVPAEAPRRITRSALRLKPDMDVGKLSMPLANGSAVQHVVKSEDGLVFEVNEKGDVGTATKKLELKMSKKSTLGSIPHTVKKFVETGLLDGYNVFYNGSNKGSALRGVIKDGGILCFCRLCQGSRVVSPCQFEIHACNTYRNAAQYVCLENGKSLQQVVTACRNTPLDALEETIQSLICSLPVKKSTICLNCKGSFMATYSRREKQSCESCADVKNLEIAVTPATITDARSSRNSLEHMSSKPASSRILSPHKVQGKIRKKLAKAVLRSSSGIACVSPQKKSQWKITKKDLGMHKVVFGEGGLPDGTEVAYYSRGKKLLEGYKIGLGIFCRCCNSEVSPSQFEAHAGWASRRKPYGYIYTSNGVSLHEFAISLLLKGHKKVRKENDDLCIICADGGNLLLCDGCPRAFHMECASLSTIPRGKWYCNYCQNMFQREKYVVHNANAVAAGRVPGADPFEQITKRCIRIVKTPEEAEIIACLLCRGSDFSKSGFGPWTVIVCDQCEKEYHVGCLKQNKMADLKELPEGKWFCSMDCGTIHSALQNFVTRGEEKIPDSNLDIMKKKYVNQTSDSVTDFDVRWRLLRGKVASPETRSLLSKAVAIFHHCFDPIVDSVTGRDFIPSMVYGRNFRGQDFGGMYCAVLSVNSSVVSVGIFRVFGQEIAELPLVATDNGHQGKGYFQTLFSCIEKLLASLAVKNLVLPAADEAVSIWTDKFGFEKILAEQLTKYRKTSWQMLTFKGTSMLHKMVPPPTDT